jgi:hypothetical protein
MEDNVKYGYLNLKRLSEASKLESKQQLDQKHK